MGIYSKKIKSLDQLKTGDKIAVNNDPTQEARSLALLEKAHVIKLRSGVGINATKKDIIENPKKIQLLEVDAAMTPRTLDDATCAAINSNYAMEAKLNPKKDSIFLESVENSPWINYITAREDNKNSENVKKFIKIYQSKEVKKFIDDHFQGSIIAAF
jgi:D-methionine transport system substrate-binding protein